MRRCRFAMTATVGAIAALASPFFLTPAAHADRQENLVAVFSALDKVTARTLRLEVPLGETATFGSLKITPRVCYSRPETEQPKTTSFVEVDEVSLDGTQTRIFTGWMLAESPGLNAVEHPVADVWLTECQKPQRSLAQRGRRDPPATANGEPQPVEPSEPLDDPLEPPRRRVRR